MKKIHNYKKLSSLPFLLLGITIFCCFISCKKENLEELSFVEIETGESFKESATEVVLSGNLKGIIDDGQVEILAYGHVYSLIDTEPEINSMGSDTTMINIPFGERVKNGVYISTFIPPDTSAVFYYRAYVRVKKLVPEKDTILYAENMTSENDFFTFHVPTFNVNINSDIIIDEANVRVSGSISNNDVIGQSIKYGHIWSKNKNTLQIDQITNSNDTTCFAPKEGNFEFISIIKNLKSCSTKYYIKSYASTMDGGIAYSELDSFVFEGSNIWQERKPLLDERFGGVSFVINDNAYVGFGYNDNNDPLNDFWRYDPKNDSWITESIIGGPSNVKHAESFVIGNEAYVAFGTDGTIVNNNIWKFDGTSWSDLGSLIDTIPPRHSAFSFVIGDILYIGGGVSSGELPTNDCEIFNDLWEINFSNNEIRKVFPGPTIHQIAYESLMFSCDGVLASLLIECIPVYMGVDCDMQDTTIDCSIKEMGIRAVSCDTLCPNIPNECMIEYLSMEDSVYYKEIDFPDLDQFIYQNDTPSSSYLLKRYGAIAFSRNNKGYIFFGKTVDGFEEVYDYYLEFNQSAPNRIKVVPLDNSFVGEIGRSYPFSFEIGDGFYFGGGIPNAIIDPDNLNPTSLDFWKFDPTSGTPDFTPLGNCGLNGLSMGIGFSLKTLFITDNGYRGYVGLGRESDGSSAKIFTYIPEFCK